MKLPNGRVAQIEPDWFGKLAGLTLLYEALVLALAQQMTFAAVARLVNESWHRVHAICSRYVDLALAAANLSAVNAVAIDETSYRRGHNYLTIAADARDRRVVFVTEGRDATTIARFAEHLAEHEGTPEQVRAVSIDMSNAFIKGVADHLPNSRITFDKFHLVAHASAALDRTRRLEQTTDPSLKGLRWTLLKDRSAAGRADLDALIVQATSKRTARAWLYREHLRAILDRKQIHVVSAMLKQWCTNVMRSRGRANEGRGQDDPQALRRHRRLDPDATDQRFHRGPQWSVPGRQAQGPRLHALRHHADRDLPYRRKARLHLAQPVCRITHPLRIQKSPAFEQLKADPGKPGVDNLNVEIGKLQIIRAAGLKSDVRNSAG